MVLYPMGSISCEVIRLTTITKAIFALILSVQNTLIHAGFIHLAHSSKIYDFFCTARYLTA